MRRFALATCSGPYPLRTGRPGRLWPDHHYTYKEALLGLDSQKRFDACRDQAIPDGC